MAYGFLNMTASPSVHAAQVAMAPPGYKAKPERVYLLHLEAFDWNCQQHIIPRFTAPDRSRRRPLHAAQQEHRP